MVKAEDGDEVVSELERRIKEIDSEIDKLKGKRTIIEKYNN